MFVLNDQIINGQMFGMQVVRVNVRVNYRMKHAFSTSCKLRVLCTGVK